MILSFKGNSFFKPVFLGEFVTTFFDLENDNKFIFGNGGFNNNLRHVNQIKINALKYKLH